MDESLAENGLITKLEQQKRNKKRFNLYINGEYAFSVHEDVLVSLHLLKGKKITAQEVEEIMLLEEKKKIERAILHYLSYRPRTVLEVKRYLQEKGYAEDLIEAEINLFIEKGYLNDQEFAQQWITERMRTKRKGVFLLAEELRQKGISGNIIEETIATIRPEEEWEACYQLALKRIERAVDLTDKKTEYKLKQYLARRGFSIELIQRVYHEVRKEKGR